VSVTPGLWNPANLGIHSLTVSAPGTGAVVSLQGARSIGNVALSAPSGTINSAYALTSSAGTVTVNAPTRNLSATPIPLQLRLTRPPFVSPAIAPGPLRAAPDGPLIAAAPAPGGPGLAEILVSSPGAIDASGSGTPGSSGALSSDSHAELVASSASSVSEGAAEEGPAPASAGAEQGILLYSGGRGLAQSADLGRNGNYGSVPAPQSEAAEVKRTRRAAAAQR
jgi:hypothetical protein